MGLGGILPGLMDWMLPEMARPSAWADAAAVILPEAEIDAQQGVFLFQGWPEVQHGACFCRHGGFVRRMVLCTDEGGD